MSSISPIQSNLRSTPIHPLCTLKDQLTNRIFSFLDGDSRIALSKLYCHWGRGHAVLCLNDSVLFMKELFCGVDGELPELDTSNLSTIHDDYIKIPPHAASHHLMCGTASGNRPFFTIKILNQVQTIFQRYNNEPSEWTDHGSLQDFGSRIINGNSTSIAKIRRLGTAILMAAKIDLYFRKAYLLNALIPLFGNIDFKTTPLDTLILDYLSARSFTGPVADPKKVINMHQGRRRQELARWEKQEKEGDKDSFSFAEYRQYRAEQGQAQEQETTETLQSIGSLFDNVNKQN